MTRPQLALGVLILSLASAVVVTARAQSVVVEGKKPPLPPLKTAVAKASKQKEEIVTAIFKALGPGIQAQLRAGRQVELPGVGVFQVVLIAEHKDLIGGRPGIVPAQKYIEFVPAADLLAAATSPGAVPARTVDGYEFRVNPNASSGQKTEGTRAGRSRIP
jgi:nucleoid DNA-binding protein